MSVFNKADKTIVELASELKKSLELYDSALFLDWTGIFSNGGFDDGDDQAKLLENYQQNIRLMSPWKSFLYLLGLFVSTTEKEKVPLFPFPSDSMAETLNTIEKVGGKEYGNQVIDPKKKALLSGLYFDNVSWGPLWVDEYHIEYLKELYQPIEKKIGKTIGFSLQDSLDLYDFFWQQIRTKVNLFNDIGTNNFAVPDGMEPQEWSGQIFDAVFFKFSVPESLLIKKFGEAKARALLKIFALKRERRDFLLPWDENPFEKRPLVLLKHPSFGYPIVYCPRPQYLLNAIEQFFDERTVADSQFADIRNHHFESLVGDELAKLIPLKSKSYLNVTDGKGYEHDLFLVMDRCYIVVECKATDTKFPENDRRAFDKIHKHYWHQGIGMAGRQALRLKGYIESEVNPTLVDTEGNRIEIQKEIPVIPLVVTMHQFHFGETSCNVMCDFEHEDHFVAFTYDDLDCMQRVIEHFKFSQETFLSYIRWRLDNSKYIFAADELVIFDNYVLGKLPERLDKPYLADYQAGTQSLIDKIYYESKGEKYSYNFEKELAEVSTDDIFPSKKEGSNKK